MPSARLRFGDARRRVALLLAVFASGCTGSPGGSPSPDDSRAPQAAALDSIVLERTVCFGLCPAYRLSIAGSGRVHFVPTNPRDSAVTAQADSISPTTVMELLNRARAIEFFELPDDIDPAHPGVCPVAATDHPSAILTFALGDTVKRVNHYHGCHAERNGEFGDAYPELTALESAIDSAVQVERWLPRRE